ncbi:hypothetical protein M0802_016082 [Mischocyttarus mexicanus]|nr:hypothetical protein M0802_016082 [Mischocyttarus mexicanus]
MVPPSSSFFFSSHIGRKLGNGRKDGVQSGTCNTQPLGGTVLLGSGIQYPGQPARCCLTRVNRSQPKLRR